MTYNAKIEDNGGMNIYGFITISLLSLLLTSCAVGPLVSHETARTVGSGKHEFIGSYGQAGIAGKWNYGLGSNVDFGLQVESLNAGIKVKYAFLNESEGWSMASSLGYGSGFMSDHFYGDLHLSFKSGPVEPYLTLRYVQVHTDKEDFESHDSGSLHFEIDKMKFQYGQVMLGTRLWLTRHWLLSLEGAGLFSATSGIRVSDTYIFNGALGYRF